jgi:hypothetical protein
MGARTYLDVDDAMKEFHRQIEDQSREVVCGQLVEINRVCDMNWSTNDIRPYSERSTVDDYFHLGCQLAVAGFGGLSFSLKLTREEDRKLSHAVAFLYRRNQSIAASLWGSFREGAYDTSSMGPYNLFFARRLSDDNIPDFREYLDKAIIDLIAFINVNGGLRKHLEQGS